MIQMGVKKDGKAKRGRPPKSAAAKASPAPPERSPEEVVQEPEEPETYVFKSKFRQDRVTLRKPLKTKHNDGSYSVDPGEYAEFERNTWSTNDAFKAQILRDKIKERQNMDPLHIVETTHMGG